MTAFNASDLRMPNIMGTESQPDNAYRRINDRITFSFAATDFLMLILTCYWLGRHPYAVLPMSNWFSWSASRAIQTRPCRQRGLEWLPVFCRQWFSRVAVGSQNQLRHNTKSNLVFWFSLHNASPLALNFSTWLQGAYWMHYLWIDHRVHLRSILWGFAWFLLNTGTCPLVTTPCSVRVGVIFERDQPLHLLCQT